MVFKHLVLYRLIRNIFIALLSASWILPFVCSIGCMLEFMKRQEAELKIYENSYPHGPHFSTIELSQSFLTITAILMSIAVFFWAFVAANKLWPIKVKEKDKKEGEEKEKEVKAIDGKKIKESLNNLKNDLKMAIDNLKTLNDEEKEEVIEEIESRFEILDLRKEEDSSNT